MRGNQTGKKLVVSVVIIGIFVLYSFMHGHSAAAPAPATTSDGGSSGSTTSGAPASSNSSGGSTSGTSGSGQYKDGSYTGSVADAQWGYVQVKAVISGGKITNVQFLQYPSDRERSVEINSYADPQLSSEAVQAQSAQVDVVSGATDSSDAFMQSLSDALSQAQG